MIKLWVDDLRLPPEGWVWAKTYWDAKQVIDNNKIEEISLDHDLGDIASEREMTGYDVLMYIVMNHVTEQKLAPKHIHIHTANPVAKERMLGVIERYLSNR